MARGNDYWPKDELLAAALLQIEFDWPDGTRGPIMDHDTAKKLTARDIISLFDRDHDPIKKVDGGPNVAWNCTWRPKHLHRLKTAKIDVPTLRKGERIVRKEEAFRQRVLAKSGQALDPKPGHVQRSRWPKGRKIPSRPFPKRSPAP